MIPLKSYAVESSKYLRILDIAKNLSNITLVPANPSPEERYTAARKNLERFSSIQTWWALNLIQTLQPPLGFGFNPETINPALNEPNNVSSPFWKSLNKSGEFSLYYFPPYLNLHLLNIIYYNSLASDFFKDIVTLPAVNSGLDATQQIVSDSFAIEGWNPATSFIYTSSDAKEPVYASDSSGFVRCSLLSLTSLIQALAIEPNAFPVILKLPTNDFLFLFVRNSYADGDLLTSTQQMKITKKNPIKSYIKIFNNKDLKILSYLSVKACKNSDGNFYYTPTDIYSLDIPGFDKLKHAYVISMFAIALKFFGSITMPWVGRDSPPAIDAQITESVRYLFNPNYISMYDRNHVSDTEKVGYTYKSSEFWGLNKLIPSTTNIPNMGAADSHPDLLGLGNIFSSNPQNNEIIFIDVTQWDITEGLKENNALTGQGFLGSFGIINFNDYNKDKFPPLEQDKISGILYCYDPPFVMQRTVINTASVSRRLSMGSSVSTASSSTPVYSSNITTNLTGKGFIYKQNYNLSSNNGLFIDLRSEAAKSIIPAQNGSKAGSKFFNIRI